jgi:putative colanic acid biosynthesis UDP-glucose lipid carrier transferase
MGLYKNKIYSIKFWADIITITICLVASLIATKSKYNSHATTFDVAFWLFLIACWYFTSKSNHLYDDFHSRRLSVDVFKTLNNILFQGVLCVLFLFTIQQYGRLLMFVYIALLCICIPFEKFLIKKIFLGSKKIKQDIRNILIVGAGENGMEFFNILKSNPNNGYKVMGFLDDEKKPYLNGQYLGKVNYLEEILKKETVDEVVITLPNTAEKQIHEVVDIVSNEAIRLRIVPDYFRFKSSKYFLSTFGGLPLLTVRYEPLEDIHWRSIKRAFDVIFSLVILTGICSWLFPIVAILIKLESRGPVFFKQLRAGRNNLSFYCLKFRSMYKNKDADLKLASKDDARITRLGKFIRRTSIDELPQFLNVLAGNMSIVGPRPHMLSHNEMYSKIIRQYRVRHLIKPGITGWAQVNGYRGETKTNHDMQLRVEHDVWYLENWSFRLDLKIIFLTIWNMIKGEENAY